MTVLNSIGIGYIEKVLKNKIKWVGNNENYALENEINSLRTEFNHHDSEEKELDKLIEKFQNSLSEITKDEAVYNHSYVTFEDILALDAMTKEANQNFLVVRAPKGTILEIPSETPENDEYPHKIKMESQEEELILYMVSEEGNMIKAGETSAK
jgi:hypothetical protein